jgi:hypothetical protein
VKIKQKFPDAGAKNYVAQQRQIRYLERKLKTIQPDTATPSIAQEPKETDQAEPKITIPTATSGGGQTRFQ